MSHNKDKEFLQAILDKSKLYKKTTLEEFMLTNIFIKSSRGVKPYSFDGYAFYKDIVRGSSNHPNIIFLKGAQIGYSTYALGRIIWKILGTSYKAGIYFPSDVYMKDFFQSRVVPLIETSPFLKKTVYREDGDRGRLFNTRQVKLDDAFLVMRGSWTKMGVKSVDLDVVMLDEVDEHDPENIEFIADRLLASEVGWMVSGSQPSLPEYGIHQSFLNSDQHYWLIKCGKCNEWNDLIARFIEDQESIWKIESKNDKIKAHYACKKCSAKLDNQKGQYVPKFKSEKRGYQISQLFVGNYENVDKPTQIYLKYIDSKGSTTKRKNFWISYIGLPFSTDEEKPLTLEVIHKNEGLMGLKTHSDSFTFHGADQGDTVHAVFGEPASNGKIRIIGLYKGHILDEDRYMKSLQQYNVFSGVIDAMPNRNWSIKMALRFNGLKIQFFSKKYALNEEVFPGEETVEVIKVNRDESLQDTVDAIKNGMFIFPNTNLLNPIDLALYEEFKHHLTMLIRERGEDENGKSLWQFKKKVANHFGMALNSMRLAVLGGTDTITQAVF